jgi:hypothetical protein
MLRRRRRMLLRRQLVLLLVSVLVLMPLVLVLVLLLVLVLVLVRLLVPLLRLVLLVLRLRLRLLWLYVSLRERGCRYAGKDCVVPIVVGLAPSGLLLLVLRRVRLALLLALLLLLPRLLLPRLLLWLPADTRVPTGACSLCCTPLSSTVARVCPLRLFPLAPGRGRWPAARYFVSHPPSHPPSQPASHPTKQPASQPPTNHPVGQPTNRRPQADHNSAAAQRRDARVIRLRIGGTGAARLFSQGVQRSGKDAR